MVVCLVCWFRSGYSHPPRFGHPTMDLATALQRLANYRTKNTRASREIFESGVVVFRNNALHKLADDSAFSQ